MGVLYNKFFIKFSKFSFTYILFMMCASHILLNMLAHNIYHDGDSRNSLVQMLDGSAHKPYVYRSF